MEHDADPRPRQLSTVERAYELAREGPCVSIDDIRHRLEREHYSSVTSHLSGPTIRRQLRQICRDRIVAGRTPPVEPGDA